MADRGRILVVDDHVEMARLLADQLGDEGYAVEVARGGAQALASVRKRAPDVVITDLRMEGVDGFDVLDGVRAADPAVPVLIMTAFGGIDSAIEAMRRGAFHYFTKPFQLAEVRVHVERALEHRALHAENRELKRLVGDPGVAAILGDSPPIRRLRDLVVRAAQVPAPVLIRGESGTGKELVARAVHACSPRKDGPFVAVNVTTLPANLLESELFGHVKGAFTGATGPRKGLFVEAHGGTLFLDEIGDMPVDLQATLLRVLEDGVVRPVGADAPRTVDVRIVAATNQPLEDRIRDGRFRSDLLYRLDVVPVRLPPLRDRREDIPLLAGQLLARIRREWPTTRVTRLSAGLVQALQQHDWPGNVRELENLIRRLVVVAAGEVADVDDLQLGAPELVSAEHPLERARRDLIPLRDLEQAYIAHVIAACGGNKTRAAEILGIDVSTIHRRAR